MFAGFAVLFALFVVAAVADVTEPPRPTDDSGQPVTRPPVTDDSGQPVTRPPFPSWTRAPRPTDVDGSPIPFSLPPRTDSNGQPYTRAPYSSGVPLTWPPRPTDSNGLPVTFVPRETDEEGNPETFAPRPTNADGSPVTRPPFTREFQTLPPVPTDADGNPQWVPRTDWHRGEPNGTRSNAGEEHRAIVLHLILDSGLDDDTIAAAVSKLVQSALALAGRNVSASRIFIAIHRDDSGHVTAVVVFAGRSVPGGDGSGDGSGDEPDESEEDDSQDAADITADAVDNKALTDSNGNVVGVVSTTSQQSSASAVVSSFVAFAAVAF